MRMRMRARKRRRGRAVELPAAGRLSAVRGESVAQWSPRPVAM